MHLLRWVSLLLFLGSPLLHGDYIYLKNGRKIEGTVIEERPDVVVFEMAMGSITYDRSKIERIEYNEEGNRQRELKEQSQTFDQEIRDFKKAMSGLYSEKTTVRLMLNRAREAESEVNRMEDRLLQARKDLAEARKDFEPFARFSGKKVSPQIYEKYVTLSARVDSSINEVQSLENEAARVSEKKQEADSKMIQAQQAIAIKVSELRDRYLNLIERGCPPEPLNSVNRMLEAEGSFSEKQVIPLRRMGNSYIVSVRINNALTEDFILDTGCSGMSIPLRIYQNLKLSQECILGKSYIGIANGEQVEATVLNLESVQVGTFSVSNVVATVPTASNQDVPALLGMSFLKHFHFSIDTAGGRLILERIGE